ncbi:MAG: gamma-glutamyl-gamma-aminobutyrate hydrolase family protein [Rickettsiaceae bacterium H1]|nr:gamma-glutamyl-gamma-aminobutyrate hydrolase family protein [Rickettsiaceae bacterium H1]
MKRIFLLFLVLSFGVAYAEKPLVGFLRTHKETYPKELGLSHHIMELINKFGADVILIDYNELAKQKGNLEKRVRKFIKDNNITKVIIPGNNYNLDAKPFPPNTNRQDVTAVLAKMANEDRISLMGICGGLQGIMYAEGVELVGVQSIGGDSKKHEISFPNPHIENVPLHEIKVNPKSRLAKIIGDDTGDVGMISLYLPDAHSRVIDNNAENITKLENAGYKVIGFSNDGMIEIIEDKLGNIHFQGHPEGLLIDDNRNSKISSLRSASIDAISKVFNNFIGR